VLVAAIIRWLFSDVVRLAEQRKRAIRIIAKQEKAFFVEDYFFCVLTDVLTDVFLHCTTCPNA
jgi:hypothetical protein